MVIRASDLKTHSHQKSILWTQLVVCDLRLSGEVWRRVVVWRDEFGVLVLMELIGPRLQHALLQLNAPFELHISKSTEWHEEAEQTLLAKMMQTHF